MANEQLGGLVNWARGHNIQVREDDNMVRIGNVNPFDQYPVQIWDLIKKDHVAMLRMRIGMYGMRFDINPDYVRNALGMDANSHLIYANKIGRAVGPLPAPDPSSSDCLTVTFADTDRTLCVSKAMICFHSSVIRTILENPHTADGGQTVHMSSVHRSTFKMLLYIIYYGASYLMRPECMVKLMRMRVLEPLLDALRLLKMPHVRASVAKTLKAAIPLHDSIALTYNRFLGPDKPRLVYIPASGSLCTCRKACDGIVCGQIADAAVRDVLANAHGKYAIYCALGLIMVLDRFEMYDVLLVVSDHVIQSDSFHSGFGKSFLEVPALCPFSAKTYAIITARLIAMYRDHTKPHSFDAHRSDLRE